MNSLRKNWGPAAVLSGVMALVPGPTYAQDTAPQDTSAQTGEITAPATDQGDYTQIRILNQNLKNDSLPEGMPAQTTESIREIASIVSRRAVGPEGSDAEGLHTGVVFVLYVNGESNDREFDEPEHDPVDLDLFYALLRSAQKLVYQTQIDPSLEGLVVERIIIADPRDDDLVPGDVDSVEIFIGGVSMASLPSSSAVTLDPIAMGIARDQWHGSMRIQRELEEERLDTLASAHHEP